MVKAELAARTRKPGHAIKGRIVELARQGLSNTVIARDLNVDGRNVSGVISNARRRGVLDPSVSSPPLPTEPKPMLQQKDDFKEGRFVVGSAGGLAAPSMQVRYTVERMVPPDGLLGSHFNQFSIEELGKEYGEGVYKIVRHEPGRSLPMEFTQKVGSSYGHPKFPRATTGAMSVVPTKMIERSILNRLMECRQVLDSATTKMKQKKVDPAVIKGETDFLLSSIKDIGSLLIHLPRNGK